MGTKLSFEEHLSVGKNHYKYYSIEKAAAEFGSELLLLPSSLKILLENVLRHCVGSTRDHAVKEMCDWVKNGGSSEKEVFYKPSRVLMQDFTGVPAVVDLAAMRDAMVALKGTAKKINPQIPVDLVIDHSVQVDVYGKQASFDQNVSQEFARNKERYEFLKWGQKSFSNFRVVPPGVGICHQVNLEYLAKVVMQNKDKIGDRVAYPDTVIGTDSHTTMINGLSVLGWGVGGIEAEAAMLGEAISMLIPDVIGFHLQGRLAEGVTATDLVLTVTNILRKEGVVGKFVEFYGEGVKVLSLPDRATIANMAPEYGATCGFFPTDEQTLSYMRLTGRAKDQIMLVEAYTKAQGLWHDDSHRQRLFTKKLDLDLKDVVACVAGPKRPQDRIILGDVHKSFVDHLKHSGLSQSDLNKEYRIGKGQFLKHGHIVIAAITSCTNTSNPSVMLAAGLIAKKAIELGLKVPAWVKTSLAPGSQVVSEYLQDSGLQQYLDQLGFNLVGYGCTTCIGNSGPLKKEINDIIRDNKLHVASVLSGNRNFEGRIHPLVSENYLASPPLVVVYAISGTMNLDISKDIIAKSSSGKNVYLRDLWPSNSEIQQCLSANLSRKMFVKKYRDVFSGSQEWVNINAAKSSTYQWHKKSTYIQNPPYFIGMDRKSGKLENVIGARILGLFGDSITTDHISPAGNIADKSSAGEYLKSQAISQLDFNSYGARRGNHEVMMRGTFANIRIKNEMLSGAEGGMTVCYLNGKTMSIYDAAMQYQKKGIPLVVVAGKEYGSGSSRDWAAKGPKLLGVKAIIAESFERIHRSNLVGMGIMPLVFLNNDNRKSLHLTGREVVDVVGFSSFSLGETLSCRIYYEVDHVKDFQVKPLIYTQSELDYIKNGGVLNYVLRSML